MVTEEQKLNDEADSDPPLNSNVFTIPIWLRKCVVFVFSILLVISLMLFVRYVFSPTKGLEPDTLGLPSLIVFLLLGIVAFLIPWEDFGLRIKKFGPFEFEEILSTQAEERAQDIVELRKKISELEKLILYREKIKSSEGVILEKPHNFNPIDSDGDEHTAALETILLKFLGVRKRTAYSPLRILNWGSTQEGFKDLSKYSVSQIRAALQSLVVDGKVRTTISKKGNTLFIAIH